MARSSAAKKRVSYTKNVGSQGKANPNVQALPRTVQSQNLTALQGVQWPANLPTDKPYPDMPQVSDLKPLLQQYGASGVAIFSGIITSEEYNPDFAWRDGIRIYEQMLRNDGQIAAVRDMVELPIRRATWSVEPFSSDPKDQEVASFIESCLFHDMCYETTEGRKLYQKWDDILRHALMHLWYGFMCFEVNWRVEDGWVKWANWTPLIPRTVWRWWVGEDNELTGIQQWTFKNYSYQFVNIPAEKILLFSHRQEGNNYEGVSALRQAYKDWYYKTQYEKIQAIGIERNAVVPPVVKLPENYTSNDVQVAQMIAQNMRANELMGVTIPSTWDIEFPRNQQRYAANSLEAIQYHDVMIARRMLCQFLNLGSNETGTYALADTQVQTFLSALQTIANYIEDVINSDAIPRLCDYNFDNLEGYPKLKSSRLQADIKVISDALKSVLGQNALLTPYPELQSWFADQLGIPTPPAQDNPITQTNPTKPTNPDQPDKQQGKPDDAGTKQVTGSPVDDGGNVGNMLAEMTEQVSLLRESMAAMDAVERGEQHMLLYNPYHFPAGERGGQFAPKGGGIGGGGGFGRSGGGEGVTHVSHHAAGMSGGRGVRHEHSIESIHARAHAAQTSGGLPRETHPHEELKAIKQIEANRFNPYKSAGSRENVAAIREAYGDHQFGAAIHKYTTATLREMARENGVDLHGARSHDEIVSRITAHVTGGKYSANFGHTASTSGHSTRSRSGKSTDARISRLEARMTRAESAHSAEKSAHEETKRQLKAAQRELARVQRENETLRARAEGTKGSRSKASKEQKEEEARQFNARQEELDRAQKEQMSAHPFSQHEISQWERGNMSGHFTINPYRTLNPYLLARMFGHAHLDMRLSQEKGWRLRQGVHVVQHFNPGTRPKGTSLKAMREYIVHHVTHGAKVKPFDPESMGPAGGEQP